MRRHKHQRPATDKTPVFKQTLDRYHSAYGFPVREGDWVMVELNQDGTVRIELSRSKNV